jgi:hypothetical protein
MATQPEVGMGATYHINSDCSPYTIVSTNATGKTIQVQRDDYHAVSGTYPDCEYEYTPNLEAQIETYTRRKNGVYHLKGQPMTHYSGLTIGRRRYYRDPHF